MRKKSLISRADMSAMFHCVITLKNGMHQVLRMTFRVMASLVHDFREASHDLWIDGWTIIDGQTVMFHNIKSMRFTNERTKELYLDIE